MKLANTGIWPENQRQPKTATDWINNQWGCAITGCYL